MVGYVDDVRPFMETSDVFLMPLRMGSGTRLKALQAMAVGIPIVSTPLGVEGLALGDPPAVALGSTAQEAAECCINLLEDPAVRSRMSQEARRIVESQYSWDGIVRDFHNDLYNLSGEAPNHG